MDVIFAEATPPGRGGISIVRLSGAGSRQIAEELVGPMRDPRRSYHRAVRADGETIDHAMVIRMEHGASFTGEEMAELHLHGAPVVVRRVGQVLLDAGARPAEPGEFTRRAFLNGRMDLAEIEGLGDLLAAETEAQRKLALRSTSGELARKYAEWRAVLIRAGALIEASIDFADEDVPEYVPAEVYSLIETLRDELARELKGFDAAERIRVGFEVAIIGPPNAGKSSLLNVLASRDLALVSEIAGTTRDVIELRLDLGGLAVTMLDTAGLRDSEDAVERAGIDLARRRAEAADLRIHLSPTGERVEELHRDGDLVLRSKVDCGGGSGVSAVSRQGIDELLEQLRSQLSERVADAGLISHQRQMHELHSALRALQGFRDSEPEILAEMVRRAALALDRLVGKLDAEDYLDVIFASFCVGK